MSSYVRLAGNYQLTWAAYEIPLARGRLYHEVGLDGTKCISPDQRIRHGACVAKMGQC
jgi:hypothetical protein